MKSLAGGRWMADADVYLPGSQGRATTMDAPLDILPATDQPSPPRSPLRGPSLEQLRQGVPETAFQPDDRRMIDETRSFPYSAICGLSILNRRQQLFFGTGFLAGPRLVITAGHNVFFHGEGFMEQITVYPGLNGNRQAPPFRFARATQFLTVEAWARDAERQFDFGAIILPTDLGTDAGWLSVGSFTEGTLAGATATIAGYPKTPPPSQTPPPQQASEVWQHIGPLSVEPNRLRYGIDTTEGQSGSPVIINIPQKAVPYFAVGIHNWGFDTYNAATRINDAVFSQIVQWRKASDAPKPGDAT